MERYGVRFSQLDAAYPLSGKDGPLYGVPYVLKSIPWAKHAGCERIATTDGLHKPEGLSDDEAMELMKRSYGQILEVAEAYEITINIEVHGYFTTNPDMMERMLHFCDSPYLGMNLDTGNPVLPLLAVQRHDEAADRAPPAGGADVHPFAPFHRAVVRRQGLGRHGQQGKPQVPRVVERDLLIDQRDPKDRSRPSASRSARAAACGRSRSPRSCRCTSRAPARRCRRT